MSSIEERWEEAGCPFVVEEQGDGKSVYDILVEQGMDLPPKNIIIWEE